MSIVDLKYEREKAEDDNKLVRPESLVRMCLDDLQGRTDLTKVMIIVESQNENGDYDIDLYRAGCTRYEEIALLELAKTTTLKKWTS